MIELRDGSGKLWPMYWLAHPQGSGTLDAGKGTGSFTLTGAGSDVELIGGSRDEKRIAGNLVVVKTEKGQKGEDLPVRVGPAIELKIELTGVGKPAKVAIGFNGQTVSTEGDVQFAAAANGRPGIDIKGSCKTTTRALGLDKTETPVLVKFYAPGRPAK
jgi:hypothetical protein